MKKIITLALLIALAATSSQGATRIPAKSAVLTRQLKAMPASVGIARANGAYLDEEPVYDPEGTEETWIMDAIEYDWMGQSPQLGEKMLIRRSADGKTIWFRDLAPMCNYDEITDLYGWIKGTVEGDVITVKAGQVLLKSDSNTLYLETVTMDEYGNFKEFKPEIHFTVSDGTIVQTENDIYVSAYEDAEDISQAGFFVFINGIRMQPIDDIVTVTPPAGKEEETWVMKSDNTSYDVKVVLDGDNVYVKGLVEMAPQDWLKGTVSNGTLTFPAFTILTSNIRYYLRIVQATEGEPDESGNPTMTINPGPITFTVVKEGEKFTLTPAKSWLLVCDYPLQSFLDGQRNVSLFAYAGDVPAVPATPVVQFWSADDMMLQFNMPCEDVDGNFINPEKLSYRLYFDGVPHVFTTSEYIMLMEDMTEIPYYFTENYDIYTKGALKTVFLHGETPADVSIESVYTVDGVTNVSGRASTGIEDVTVGREIVDVTYTDILGRRLETPAPGTAVIKRTRYSDGTVDTVKQFGK